MWKENLDDETAAELLPHTFVNVQVLVPLAKGDFGPSPAMESLLNDIKEARNTSVQVSEKSLADARHHFDQLKAALDKESYSNRIIWHEGQKGSIDVLELIALLMIFFPHYSNEAAGGEPHGLYGRKQHALDSYLKFTEGQHRNELMKWINVLPDLVTLFDHIQNTLPDKYEGHFGRIREVKIYDESKLEKGRKYRKTPFKSKFFDKTMKYSVPVGFVYPMFSGLRVLARFDGDAETVKWKTDPVAFWDRHGSSVVREFKRHLEEHSFETKKIATSPTTYQTVRYAVSNIFKDELLQKAGIEA